MSSLSLAGDTSGNITVSAPAVAGTNTLTLQAATATNAVNTRATAVASTSGTSIDFTGLPDWIKKITIMFSGVSLSGSSAFLVQIGTSGGIQNTGYTASSYSIATAGGGGSNSTIGFSIECGAADRALSGNFLINNITSGTWVASTTCNSASNSRTPPTTRKMLMCGSGRTAQTLTIQTADLDLDQESHQVTQLT